MTKGTTHYHVLGLEPGVTLSEIKRAYRKLVKSYHPDLKQHDSEGRINATKRMMQLNEAYETLKDKGKRAVYDRSIGLGYGGPVWGGRGSLFKEEEARELYLKRVFHPSRQVIFRVLNMYQQELRQLSLDIYDDALIEAFQDYCNEVERALRQGAEALAKDHGPPSLEPAVKMMLYSIAQAADGLEELRRFCQNYDYSHLTLAENLFRIAQDLSRQSLKLTKP